MNINMYWYEDQPIQPNPGAPVPEIVQRLMSMKEGEVFVYLARSEPHKRLALKGVRALVRVMGWVMTYTPVREGQKRGFEVCRCTSEQSAGRVAKPGLFAPELTVGNVTFPAERYEACNRELEEIDAFMRRVSRAKVGKTLRMVCPYDRAVSRQVVLRREALLCQKGLSFRQVRVRTRRRDGESFVEYRVTVCEVRKPARYSLPQQRRVGAQSSNTCARGSTP